MSDDKELTFFFCVGARKTGTTILARLLDQHPKIACICEGACLRPTGPASIFNPNSHHHRHNGFSAESAQRWLAQFAPYRPHTLKARLYGRLIGRPLVPVRLMRRLITEVLTDFADRCGCPTVGDKWPGYSEYIDVLHRIFPKARYIYNVRDPRAVWNSGQHWMGRGAGEEILDCMLNCDKVASRYQGHENFTTVRYEDYVLEPEETLAKLYTFLGHDFSRDYLRYDRDRDPYPDRWGFVPEAATPLSWRHVTKWKQKLTPEELQRITAKSASFVRKYGYEEDAPASAGKYVAERSLGAATRSGPKRARS